MNPAHLGPDPRVGLWLRGLWGLYARDPFEGEDAPAGPMYNRDKSVSRAWYDPVGWAGLDKVAPPTETLEAIVEQRADIISRCDALRDEIDDKSRQLKSSAPSSRRCATGPTSTPLTGKGPDASPSSEGAG